MVLKHIDKHLFLLTKKMERYVSMQNDLNNFNDQYRDKINDFSFTPPRSNDIFQLTLISGRRHRVENECSRLLREVDNTSSIIAGNIAYLIDMCIENYQVPLKMWIVNRLRNLADLRNMASNASYDFYFPTLSATLSPYIFRTKTLDNKEKFAIVRNAIRDLIN